MEDIIAREGGWFLPLGDSLLSKESRSIHGASSGEALRGPNRPNGQTLGQLCTLVLATHKNWPKKFPSSICMNAHLDSIYPDPANELSINLSALAAKMENKPRTTRLCAFHRYLRAMKLAEIIRDQTLTFLDEGSDKSRLYPWGLADIDEVVAGNGIGYFQMQ